MEQGWVYILTSPQMPGLIKIAASAKQPQKRMRWRTDTGKTCLFDVAYQICCNAYQEVERAAHESLARKKAGGKNFFACTVIEAAVEIRACTVGGFSSEEYPQAGPSSDAVVPPEMPSESNTQASRPWDLAIGALVLAILLVAVFGLLDNGGAEAESGAATGFDAAPVSASAVKPPQYRMEKIGASDIKLRNCPSTSCAAVAVLPAGRPVEIQPKTRTGDGWVRARFSGEACYPEGAAGKACAKRTEEKAAEGWIFAANLYDVRKARADENVLDALF
ncbi:GIY-YIG nuclease family protein [Neisseria chenwenguii]|uniref:GIY-YIG nuclease family protein n=1 Tax=Neisseria chenwenguii TaxID=1853278 RepID=UPI0012FD0FFB|nr:GIY-YIG nuclease family protein [Neisseria chenwenguii]